MRLRQKIVLGIFSVLTLHFLAGCVKLPDNSDRKSSQVISDGENTRLGLAFKTLVEQHPGESGCHPARQRPRCLCRAGSTGQDGREKY